MQGGRERRKDRILGHPPFPMEVRWPSWMRATSAEDWVLFGSTKGTGMSPAAARPAVARGWWNPGGRRPPPGMRVGCAGRPAGWMKSRSGSPCGCAPNANSGPGKGDRTPSSHRDDFYRPALAPLANSPKLGEHRRLDRRIRHVANLSEYCPVHRLSKDLREPVLDAGAQGVPRQVPRQRLPPVHRPGRRPSAPAPGIRLASEEPRAQLKRIRASEEALIFWSG